MSRLRFFLLEDWRIPFAVLSLVASLALFASPYFYVTIQNERKERLAQIDRSDRKIAGATRDLCRAVLPTRAIYSIVLAFPSDDGDEDDVSPEQAMAFRRELMRGVRAVDQLHCENVTP